MTTNGENLQNLNQKHWIFLSSLTCSEKRKSCKISTSSKEWREGKVRRRKDGKGWEETTCGYLTMCFCFQNGKKELEETHSEVMRSLTLGSTLWTEVFLFQNLSQNTCQNKSTRGNHILQNTNSIFWILHTWSPTHGHTVKHRHTNSTCAFQSLIKILSVTADGHNVSLSAKGCFALFGSSFPSPWQKSDPKHNGRQQLADWLTAKPLAPVAYRVIVKGF